MSAAPIPFITPDALLAHWQGHHLLGRRHAAVRRACDGNGHDGSADGARRGLRGLEHRVRPRSAVEAEGASLLGREHGATQRALAADPAAAIPGDADRLRSVH